MSTSDKKLTINKKAKKLDRDELEKLSKKELIDRILQLEAHNFQLRNILQKKNDQEGAGAIAAGANTTTTSAKRNFDFSKAHKRHVLLKLLYFGWEYNGFATQEDSGATIEYHLFKALERTCLIESRAASNYHRCGRTDKGVSAFCQVISIDLRSKFSENEQMNEENFHDEIDYCTILNGVLPKNIQCIAWMPVKNKLYSARFDCVARTYRYFFPTGDLDIKAMQEGCKLLEGSHDFRNFCKMDVNNGVTKFRRLIYSADILSCRSGCSPDESYNMHYLEIRANAFLWHQIRCIMAILLLIGNKNEEPSVIAELLDVEKNPCKPQYTPAIGLPLNLYNCEFRAKTREKPKDDGNELAAEDFEVEEEEVPPSEADTTNWVYKEESLSKLIVNLQGQWSQMSVKTTMIREVLHSLEQMASINCHMKPIQSQIDYFQEQVKSREYQKLLNRKRCESLENRIEHFVKKQRLIVKD